MYKIFTEQLKAFTQLPITKIIKEPVKESQTPNLSRLAAITKPTIIVPKLEQIKNVEKFGLPNLGNTCYYNASIQLLRAIPELANGFSKPNNFDLIQYYNLFNKVIFNKEKITKDLVLFCCIKGVCIGRQQDVQENLDNLLQNYEKINKQNLDLLYNNYYSGLFWKLNNKPCSEMNIQKELFLKIDSEIINIGNSLQEYIHLFLNQIPEELKDANCENEENKKGHTIKKNNYLINSEYLLIQLKIFEFNNETFRISKINKNITIEPIIKIPNINTKSLKTIDKFNNYQVIHIIVHSGVFEGGHYYTYGQYNNQWYLFNDSTIREKENLGQIEKENYNKGTPYIILLKKIIQ